MREALISNGTVQSIGPRLIYSFLIVLVLMFTAIQAAQAEPQDLTGAKSQAATLEAQLAALTSQAEALTQKYDSANIQLAQTEADAADNATLLAQAQQDQTSAESALSERLVHIYKEGPGSTLDILLSSTSWSDLLDRLTLLERISKQDADLLQQVTTYRAQVADRDTKLAAQLEKQQAAASQVEAARQAVTEKLAQTEQLAKGKEAEVAQLEKEWQAQQAQQARLQQERQAKLQAALAAAQVAAQKNNGDNSGGNGGSGNTGGSTGGSGNSSSGNSSSGNSSSGSGGSGNSSGGTNGGTGGQSSHQGVSNVLKPEQIALVAQKAGFSGENLVIAVAVAMTESHSDADAIGGSHTYGLWQILSYAHPNLIDPNNPDASKWYDPYVNATFAWKISGGGTNWVPWSTYESGAYQKNMDQAHAGVALLLSNPQSVVPPSAN